MLWLRLQLAAAVPVLLWLRRCFIVSINKVRRMALTPTHPHTFAFIFVPGGVESDLHWSLCIEGEGAGVSEVSSQDAGRQREEDLAQPDRESEST